MHSKGMANIAKWLKSDWKKKLVILLATIGVFIVLEYLFTLNISCENNNVINFIPCSILLIDVVFVSNIVAFVLGLPLFLIYNLLYPNSNGAGWSTAFGIVPSSEHISLFIIAFVIVYIFTFLITFVLKRNKKPRKKKAKK